MIIKKLLSLFKRRTLEDLLEGDDEWDSGKRKVAEKYSRKLKKVLVDDHIEDILGVLSPSEFYYYGKMGERINQEEHLNKEYYTGLARTAIRALNQKEEYREYTKMVFDIGYLLSLKEVFSGIQFVESAPEVIKAFCEGGLGDDYISRWVNFVENIVLRNEGTQRIGRYHGDAAKKISKMPKYANVIFEASEMIDREFSDDMFIALTNTVYSLVENNLEEYVPKWIMLAEKTAKNFDGMVSYNFCVYSPYVIEAFAKHRQGNGIKDGLDDWISRFEKRIESSEYDERKEGCNKINFYGNGSNSFLMYSESFIKQGINLDELENLAYPLEDSFLADEDMGVLKEIIVSNLSQNIKREIVCSYSMIKKIDGITKPEISARWYKETKKIVENEVKKKYDVRKIPEVTLFELAKAHSIDLRNVSDEDCRLLKVIGYIGNNKRE